MKRILFVFILYFGIIITSKCQGVKLFYEKWPLGYIIYAANSELYPISVSLELDILNLYFSGGERRVFVIPAKHEKFKIGELSVMQPNERTGFRYKYISTLGDVTVTNYERSFEYDLPFQKGKTYKVYQGYNGSFSHLNENAIDFIMPEGSDVLAARDGLVVRVVQNNTETCPQVECAKFNNYITIMHSDGTFANYGHIKYNGSIYKVGDNVKRGEVIAYSGNVGYSNGPHLHFVCYLGRFGKVNTLETLFRVDKGEKSVLLKENTEYTREY